MTMTVASTI